MDLQSLLTDVSEQAEVSEQGSKLDLWQVLSRKGFPRPQTLDDAVKTLDRAGSIRFQFKARWLLTCIQADGPD
jgi:hypothetical protein